MRLAFWICFIFSIFSFGLFAQNNMGVITGRIVDKSNQGFPHIKVLLKDMPEYSTQTNIDGNYSFSVPVGQHILVVEFADEVHQVSIGVQADETIKVEKIKLNIRYFNAFKITGQERDFTIDNLPVIEVKNIPGPQNSVEKYLTLTTAATSNNELTNNFNVRGGSYDENLIYVNGFKIYRPFLTRSGQQEGMSFINPTLVEDIKFSAGGFTANYGDKLSSVLDITYRTPTEYHGSLSASFMGASLHIEDVIGQRFNYMVAVRYQDKGYLLNSLPVKGAYNPRYYDAQLLTNFAIKENLIWSVLGHFSTNDYLFAPQTQKANLGTVNQPLQFKVYFEGQERTKFQTITGATSLKWKINKRDKLALYAEIFNTDEQENFDILGEYFINELGKDPAKEEYGDSVGTIAIGAYLDHARNRLKATVYSLRLEGEHKFLIPTNDGFGYLRKGKLAYGVDAQYERFQDVMSEWGYIDSAGYSLPQGSPYTVDLSEVIKANNALNTFRTSGFIQYSRTFNQYKLNYPVKIKMKRKDSTGKKIKYFYQDTIDRAITQFSFNTGVRGGYTAFNQEFYLTPRAVFNYFPRKYYLNKQGVLKKRYLRLHLNSGLYYQPPFYRALQRFSGDLITNVKSQKSFHIVAGLDYDFEMWKRNTPFKLSAEIYYKYLWDVNPYYIDNLRIRYFADNLAKGFAYGADIQLHGEFIEGVQSFFKIGLLHTKIDLLNDKYYTYINSDGEEIIPGYTFNNVAVDSTQHSPGYIPRPTDQWFTFATLFQDRMPKIEQFTVQLGLNFGTPLPYGPPGHKKYRDTLRQRSYFRVDIGFGWDFLYKKPDKKKRIKIFRPFDEIKLSFEVFNLLGINNILSYQWILDTGGRYIAVPNYLTQRRFSLKLLLKW